MIMLEEYYNHMHWENFVKLYNSYWENTDYQISLLNSLNGNIDIATVIYGIFELDSHEWINNNIPALENLTPKNCIESDVLLRRLKCCLTRIPR